MNKTCLIYNFAQHYRENIFRLLDQELSVDFVFGDKYLDVKKMDYSSLSNFKKEVKNIKLIGHLTFQMGVIKLLRLEYKVFIILGDLHSISTWLLLVFAKFTRKDIYLWSHGFYGRESILKKVIKRCFFGLASGTFLYGNYARELMIKAGLDKKKLHVIYNSLNYDVQLPIREKLVLNDIYYTHFNNSYKNLIFVGRLTAEKKLEFILEALSILRSQGYFLNITFVGSGTQIKKLSMLSGQLALNESVWFFGPCYDEEMLAQLIYNADLCVSPGNVGLTAIHSMMYGTPVLTHSQFSMQGPEVEAIEKERTGYFFKNNDLNSLVESIKDWFGLCIDREIIRKNCFQIIDEKYNPHKQLEVFKKVLC